MMRRSDRNDVERAAIEHDRNLAYELYSARPTHPQVPLLAHRVLAREPAFTGMIVLLAKYHAACGDVDEARRLLKELMGRRDHNYESAVTTLSGVEMQASNYAEARRLGEMVLREQPDAHWVEHMELGMAMARTGEREAGWLRMDKAVEIAAARGPEELRRALGLHATRLFSTGAPPERVLRVAEEAYAADPTDNMLAVMIGHLYLFGYRPEEALRLFERALREEPTLEAAQAGITVTRAFFKPIETGTATLDDLREAQLGEHAWQRYVEAFFHAGLRDALAALDEVMPAALASTLRPPIDRAAVRGTSGDRVILPWHDGQERGTGDLWGATEPFRLMTVAEVVETQESDEGREDWEDKPDYYSVIFTDDAGSYLLEGLGGRLIRRSPGVPDVEVAPSVAEWMWDRVAAFGGHDPRPGKCHEPRI